MGFGVVGERDGCAVPKHQKVVMSISDANWYSGSSLYNRHHLKQNDIVNIGMPVAATKSQAQNEFRFLQAK